MQSTARRFELPLDKMCLYCDVTKKQKEDFTFVLFYIILNNSFEMMECLYLLFVELLHVMVLTFMDYLWKVQDGIQLKELLLIQN